MVFIKATFSSSLNFPCILFATAFAPNHVNYAFKVAGNVVINSSFFARGVKCVRGKSVEYVGARRAMTAASKTTSDEAGGRYVV